MKRGVVFIIALTLLMSMMAIGSSAAVEEQSINLVVEGDDAVAPGINGNAYLLLKWANNAGMKFDVLEDEIFVGGEIYTIGTGAFSINLYRWHNDRSDKELLETVAMEAEDWKFLPFEFENVYPAGTYFVECVVPNAESNAYLYPYKKVIDGRNIESHLYDKTFAEYNAEKAALDTEPEKNSNIGEGFRLKINVLKGVGENAKNFVNKYYEAKAEDVTIYDQAKYDAVMNAVGDDLKAFVKDTSEEDLGAQLANLNAALTESQPETENPPTGDYTALSVFAVFAVMACAVVVKRKVNA